MPQIDFAGNKPKFTRPQLLQHGMIPRPLAQVAPRLLLGVEWWDATRRKAYAENNACCWACGATDALEAHEVYSIDYNKQRMTYIETVALCVPCHKFIHIGLTALKCTALELKKIILHGHKILKKAKLKAHWGLEAVLPLEPWTWKVRTNIMDKPSITSLFVWNRWRMIAFDVEYPPKFKSQEEADKYYRNKENYDE